MCADCAARYVLGIADDEPYDFENVPWPEVTEEMRATAEMLRRFEILEPVGGPLHIATDDYNLESGNLAFCQGRIDARDGREEALPLAQAILDRLRVMPLPERATTLAYAHGAIEAKDAA